MVKVFARDLRPSTWNGKETGYRNINHVQFDASGDYCAIVKINGTISVWNFASVPSEVLLLPAPVSDLEIPPNSLVNVAWSSNSSLLAVSFPLTEKLETYLAVWDLTQVFPIKKPIFSITYVIC
jgi:WD40 repeat protein